jgi:hypothetical protein
MPESGRQLRGGMGRGLRGCVFGLPRFEAEFADSLPEIR